MKLKLRIPYQALALALLLSPLGGLTASLPARAAETVAVVSLTNPDRLMTDVEYLFEATGTKQFAQFFMPTVRTYFQGIDGTRPIGLVVTVDQGQFTPLGFLPVTDLDAFLAQLEPQIGQPNELENGVLEFQGGPQPVYAKQQNNWAFIGQNAESLTDLPQNPAELLGELPTKYALAMQFDVANVPQQYRDLLVMQMRSGFEQSLQQADEEDSKKLAEIQVSQMVQMIQESDQVTFGWAIDPEKQETYFDFSLTARPGTSLAQQFQDTANVKTKFSGFILPDAAVTGNVTSIIPADQIEQSVAAIDNLEQSALKEIEKDETLPDQAARTAAKQLLRNFFAILKNTVRSGRFDSASSVILEPKAMTVVWAGHVADSAAVEELIKQLIETARNEPEIQLTDIQFNAATHAGVRFHTLAVPIPEEEFIAQVLGDKLPIVIGVGETSAYIALGSNGLDHLKSMIDQSNSAQSTTVEPFQLTIALTPILRFANSVEENPVVAALAEMMAQSNGKDHVRIRAMPITNGITYRVQLEEGILKAMGMGAQMGAGGGF